jgi:hypothetical protein
MDYVEELEKQNEELHGKLVAKETENEFLKVYIQRLAQVSYLYTLSVSYTDPKGVPGDPRIDIPVYRVGDCAVILERLVDALPIRHISISRRSVCGRRGEISFTATTRFYRMHTQIQRGNNKPITDFEKMKVDILSYLNKRRERENGLH